VQAFLKVEELTELEALKMSYYFKATVEELYRGRNNKWVTFYYSDKFYVNGKGYGVGYSLTSRNNCNTLIQLEEDRKFYINDELIFQFISQHSTEQFIIEFDAYIDKNRYIIIGVTLKYE